MSPFEMGPQQHDIPLWQYRWRSGDKAPPLLVVGAILPAVFINLLALGLPPFEIGCGLLLLGPASRRVGALAVAITTAMFFIALASALLRGLTLDCGCFGIGAPSRLRMWLELVLDLVLFSGALFVFLPSIGRLRPRVEQRAFNQ